MADTKQATFIPRSSNKTARNVRRTRRIYLIGYVSYVFFFGTVLVVLGAYFYGLQVEKALEIKQAELLDKSTRFNESHISYLQEMDQRISIVENLVKQATAPSKIFYELENSVIDTIVFHNFTIEPTEESGRNLVAKFSGTAKTFDDAIYQRELIDANPVLGESEVSGFGYGRTDEDTSSPVTLEPVRFTYQLSVSPATLPFDPSVYIVESTVEDNGEIVTPEIDQTGLTDEAGVVQTESNVSVETEDITQ